MELSLHALAKKVVNGALSPLGLGVARRETIDRNSEAVADRCRAYLEETESFIRSQIFPDLAPREGRHALMLQLVGCGLMKAFYLVEHLRRSMQREGDVCEFGVAEGATSALLANEIALSERNLWLYDSFEGLPRPTEKDVLLNDIFNLGLMEEYEGRMAWPMGKVQRRLDAVAFPSRRARIVPGFLSAASPLPEKVCFAYVDFDFYEPTLLALNLLDSRLSAGGSILLDDYGYFSSGPETATREFLEARSGEYELTLPSPFSTGFAVLTKTLSSFAVGLVLFYV
jgi:O-methyltransferase